MSGGRDHVDDLGRIDVVIGGHGPAVAGRDPAVKFSRMVFSARYSRLREFSSSVSSTSI